MCVARAPRARRAPPAHATRAQLALESEEAQRHYRPLYNARVASLGPKHIAVINATTRDGFDLNRRAGVTQISASNSNLGSASNSPPFQNPISLTRVKEGDEEMHAQYADLDTAHAELDASSRDDGEAMEVRSSNPNTNSNTNPDIAGGGSASGFSQPSAIQDDVTRKGQIHHCMCARVLEFFC